MRRILLAITLLALALPAAARADVSASPITTTQGDALPSNTVVGTFDDGMVPVLCNPLSTYTATVDWGDGSGPQAATVTGPAPLTCHFSVRAGHTYTSAGSFTVTVSVTGGGAGAPGTATASVAPAKLTPLAPVTITTTAGSAFDGTIGAFSDAYTGAPASDFVAAVNWGDGGPPTTATVQATSLAGTFVVDGGHTYTAPGTYGVTIGVAAKGGGAATLNATANVGSATSPPPKAKPQTFKLSLGRITRSRDRTFALRVGCPSGEASCRGKLTLYWVSGSSHRKLGSQLFLLAGSTKATIDIRVSASNARRIARHRSVQLQAAVVALDPTAGRSASQTVTTRVRIRR